MLLDACRRLVAAPKLDKSVLPKLDAVLLSHNHYDHLDVSTVTALHREYGDTVVWYGACLAQPILACPPLLLSPCNVWIARHAIQASASAVPSATI